MDISASNRHRLPKLYWLVLPLLWMAFQFVIEVTLPTKDLDWIHSEYGLHENIQFVLIASATFLAGRSFLQLDRKTLPWLAVWFGLAALCCFFVSGEEISWGQTYLRWQTPGYWYHVNNQHETNLHNSTKWLNQKPRILLETGVITGGLIIPALRRFKPSLLPARAAVICPPSILTVTAGCYCLIQFISTFGKHVLHYEFFNRPNEVEELYLYYFVLLYMVVLRGRLKDLGLIGGKKTSGA